MRYVELCAGMGGTRAGLDRAGWECVFSADNDEDAVEIHRLAFGDCELVDVTQLKPSDIPDHDTLVAGFPCQPFSSSGTRKGFRHESGHVFESIADVIEHHLPDHLIFENVQGLLSNAFGHSFAVILERLNQFGYAVEWLLTNTLWFGIPQSRPRVILIGTRCGPSTQFQMDLFGDRDLGRYHQENGLLRKLSGDSVLSFTSPSNGLLLDEIESRQPRVGLRRPTPTTPFLAGGVAVDGAYHTFKVGVGKATAISDEALGDICCPRFSYRNRVRSVRYWGHSGETTFYLKKEPVSHCIGTNIGANPTFAIEKRYIKSKAERERLLEFSNWHREEEEVLVFRLLPERAVKLFGPGASCLKDAMLNSSVAATAQYRLLGNLVAPEVAKSVATLISKDRKRRGRTAVIKR